MDEKLIYRLDDNISFRKCSLFGGGSLTRGNCTCFHQEEVKWKNHYFCNCEGIHLHCTKHPEIEFEIRYDDYSGTHLFCPKCNAEIEIDNFNVIINKCLRMLNNFIFYILQRLEYCLIYGITIQNFNSFPQIIFDRHRNAVKGIIEILRF